MSQQCYCFCSSVDWVYKIWLFSSSWIHTLVLFISIHKGMFLYITDYNNNMEERLSLLKLQVYAFLIVTVVWLSFVRMGPAEILSSLCYQSTGIFIRALWRQNTLGLYQTPNYNVNRVGAAYQIDVDLRKWSSQSVNEDTQPTNKDKILVTMTVPSQHD